MIKNRAVRIISALVLLYAFVGFTLPPFLLKSQLVKLLDEQLNAKSSIDSLFFNPFSFRLTLEDVALKEIESDATILSFAKLSLDLDPSSLIVGKIEISEFLLAHPYVHLVIEKNKQINLTRLLRQSGQKERVAPKEEGKSGVPKVHIGSFAVEDGVFEFDDASLASAYHIQLAPISFKLENIDTAANKEGKIGFYSKIGLEGYLDVDAKVHSVMPFVADGTIKLQSNQLYEQWRYVQDFLNLEVADGQLSLDGRFYVDQNRMEETRIELDTIALKKLRIKPKRQYKDVLTLGEVRIENSTVYPLLQKLSIAKVRVDDLWADAKRAHNGRIDWQEFVQTSFPQVKKSAGRKNSSKSWKVTVDRVDISNVSGRFVDAFVTPSVTTTLTRFDANLEDFVLGGTQPMKVQSTLRLNDKFVCHDKLRLVQKPLGLSTHLECRDLDITHYNPYIEYYAKRSLKKFDLDLQRAVAGFAADVSMEERNSSILVRVENAAFELSDLQVGKKSTRKKLLGWKRLQLSGVQYESAKNALLVADIGLKNATAQIERYANKKLSVAGLVEPKPQKKRQKKSVSKALSFVVKSVHLDDAAVSFRDRALEKPADTKLHHIDIALQNITSDPKTSIAYRLKALLNKKGEINAKGSLKREPLHAASTFALRSIDLSDFSPYVEEMSYARIADGKLSIKGKALYAPSEQHPDLDLKGELHLWDFAVAKSGRERHIFQLADVGVQDFVIQTAPNRAYVNEVDINGLYVDAFLDENKTLNFAKLLKSQPKAKNNTNKERQNSKPFPFTIAKIAVNNSNALFADYSLPLKFKTEIHELQGALYALSNDPNEVSFIDMRGAVDKYGSMKLKGNIQSAKPKEFTDIEMHFRNLDMSALSGYTAEFAGYKIKNGKLFVDLKYKIEHSQMQGENALLLKNVELGEEIADENVTHLPLGLAIALLEDSNGVIDIEMPVEGNVDAPDFKYGRVIFKALANLIVKAVASPFKFLGSALGIDAEELETLEFEYGSSALLPSEREKLDKMAKILAKRPKIAFAFTPAYDEKRDSYALKLHSLVAKLLKESKLKSDADLHNALSVELLEEVYLQVHKEDELQKMQERLHKMYEDRNLYRVKYRETLLQACVDQQRLERSSLIRLAHARFDAVREYLVGQKEVDPARISAKEPLNSAQEGEKFVMMKVDVTVAK